jgi:membrane glycosyltransferase
MTAEPNRNPLRVEQMVPVRRNLRVFGFYSLAVIMTGCTSLLFADLLWRVGWSSGRVFLLVLFTILFFLISIGCVHGIYGFLLRRFRDRRRITALGDYQQCNIEGTSTALLFPIYNEEVTRTYAGVRAIYQSLERSGNLPQIDMFILSDSTDPKVWIEEERRWFELITELGALGRIYYRRRLSNEGKKSGNIRDFLSAWGQRYRYFIVMDADSVMSGHTISDLVRLMETHPTVGLIQTAPALVNAKSAFGRMQQFANRLYGPLFEAGLNYWSQDGGNYWGHNAIIRTEPFMLCCDLPKLPGRKPFGGHILSHDFVEAALMRKDNWEIWFAWDLNGSYEEGPPSILDNAQRDRRWCQGNLQHFMVLFARGLRGLSRIHLAFGILGYLAGPLWFLFLITTTYLLWKVKHVGLSTIVVEAFTPFLRLDRTGHMLLVFGLSMTALFLPKILSVVDLMFDRERRQSFGGLVSASTSALLETIFSTLHAPVQMLFHTRFVMATLFGTSVRWNTQQRSANGTTWAVALRQHWRHTLLGGGWAALVWWLDPKTLWWMLPVFSGMILSIPLSVFTSRESIGGALRRAGLFVTPEEACSPPELVALYQGEMGGKTALEPVRNITPGIEEAILDPYVNAIHVSLLREKEQHPKYTEELTAAGIRSDPDHALGERLLGEGPTALSAAEQIHILANPVLMTWLHRELWRRPLPQLASDWRVLLNAEG